MRASRRIADSVRGAAGFFIVAVGVPIVRF
jgi:hypothetical protein